MADEDLPQKSRIVFIKHGIKVWRKPPKQYIRVCLKIFLMNFEAILK